MPIITSIRKQKKSSRVNIFLDGKYGFGIDLDNFVKLGLRVEQGLSVGEIKKIIGKADFQIIYEKFLKFSMLRPRSKKELTDWLKRKKVHESMYRKLFLKLKHLDLIDDEKFAQWWVGQRLRFRAKSVRELSQELYRKGIDKNIIKDVLENSEIDENKAIKKLIEKNKWRWSKYDTATAKKKRTEYLLRKGFSWDVVKKAVNN